MTTKQHLRIWTRQVWTFVLLTFLSIAIPANSQSVDSFNPRAAGYVYSLAVQPDGKILVGGVFTWLGGQTRKYIGRLNSDGTLDSTFNPEADGYVNSLAVQAKGKILVGGEFSVLGGQIRHHIGQINVNGTLDTTFNPGANNSVYSLAVQANGKILVGGAFSELAGQARHAIGRLNTDNTLDTTFSPGASGEVWTLATQADNKILVGGFFNHLAGQARNHIGRLNTDGTLDTTFNPEANNLVYSLAVQTDGKILVGGSFTMLGGQTRNYIARLNTNGTLDTSFNPGANSWVNSIAVQTNGKILVGGNFTTLGGQTRNYIGRLNADGTLDSTFDPGASASVYSLTVQADGKVLVGGIFSTLDGQARQCIGRLNPTEPPTQSLTYDGSTIAWLRGGSSPEVYHTAFDASTNGNTWFNLGAGIRTSGGWRKTNVSLPSSFIIRARSLVTGGYRNSSGSFVEETFGTLPILGTQPMSLTNGATTTATFSVDASSITSPSYQWYKDGIALDDDGKISGTKSAVLTLTNVFIPDAGDYFVAVSNSYGSVTSLVATLTVRDPFILSQPANQTIVSGQAPIFNVTAIGSPTFSYQWRKDGKNLAGAMSSALTLTNAQASDAGNYDVIVNNEFGNAMSTEAVLTVNMATADSFNPGANGTIWTMAVQTDGKILVGGAFTSLAGQSCTNIGRLHADGTFDSTFQPGANHWVYSLTVQADGKILVGGYFTTLGEQTRNYIGRLNANGTLDTTFNPGADGLVNSFAIQADGKILVGGSFTTLGGQMRNHIGRLNTNGTLDNTFNPEASWGVHSLTLQADGKILIGGVFNTLGGELRKRIGRLNANGTLDMTFNPGANGAVRCLASQADAKILVAGEFTTLGGQIRNHLGRLNVNGMLDASFDPGANGIVNTLVLQSDGKILVGGSFSTLGGQPRNHIGRLNADGTLDNTFNPGAGAAVYSLAIQADGKVLAGGFFMSLNGQARHNIGRLDPTELATQTLTFEGSVITWLRGATAPEVSRVSFDASTDGITWSNLGLGTRIIQGWQMEGIALPSNFFIRARGFVAGGYNSSSGWLVEQTITSFPVIETQPVSRTNIFGTTAFFTVNASSTTPMNYQWFKDAVPLNNDERISGAQSATLTLQNVFFEDSGAYSVVLSNSVASASSQTATLTVIDPFISEHPTSQLVEGGQTTTLYVTAIGTAPLNYQWRKNGTNLSELKSALTLINAQAVDAGGYDVIVSNRYGSVTSNVAVVRVNMATIDSTFTAALSNSGQSVYSLATQYDGKILVGGRFSYIDGFFRHGLARLHANGAVETSFNPNTGVNDSVYAFAVQSDGKIVVGGDFMSMGGKTRSRIARLHSDGTLDNAFTPSAEWTVYSLALQPDGKIIAGGKFTRLAESTRQYIGRLNAIGSLDTAFNPGANNYVNSLALQPDGKILVGGDFTRLGGQTRNYIGRLNANGSLDLSFNPGAGNSVQCLALQADGKVVVGGDFTSLGGQTRNRIARLNADGTVDTTFNPDANNSVFSLSIQSDGKILLAGNFTQVGGQTCNRIGRLNVDGTLDTTYISAANNSVNSLALQADGKLLVGGNFTQLNEQTRLRIGRLNSDPASEILIHDASSITWHRSGTSPEAWRTTFDVSTNGVTWTSLGEGSRISDGWQLTNVSLSSAATLRARGFVSGAYHNGSSWFVESIIGSPFIYTQPVHRTNNAGTIATFSITAFDSASSYQWYKDGTLLIDGQNISGSQSPTLTLANVLGGDAGEYSVVLSNSYGSVSSDVATLTVREPVIITQPTRQSVDIGQMAIFTVTAAGTALNYQWQKDGVDLTGETSPSLIFTNAQVPDIGSYDAIVSSTYGSATSAVVTLTVNLATLDTFNPSANGMVYALALQPNGKIVVGGSFSYFHGQTRYGIGRLNVDGTLDTKFNPILGQHLGYPSPPYPEVSSLVVQPDGKILVGGSFYTLNGTIRNNIARLNEDGSLDGAFNPAANNSVSCLVVQNDGKILVGGSFTNLAGQARNRIARLNSDGSLDTSFNPGANDAIYSMVLQESGRIVVGGNFTSLAGQTRNRLARLNSDGSLDTSFAPTINSSVYSVALQADNKILVGGNFTALSGKPVLHIGRFNTNGTLDTTFNPGSGGNVYSLAIQADGRILVAGSFSSLAGQTKNRIGRLNADGTLDRTFDPQASGTVFSLALQMDGRVLLGGGFTTIGGQTRNRIARLNATESAIQELTVEGSTATWYRTGTSPEIFRTIFEQSTNGSTWASLGAGTRVHTGWQCSNVFLTDFSTLRVRGFVSGGYRNGSSWTVETATGAPAIVNPPAARTNLAGTTATFDIGAVGSALNYRWFKGDFELNDGGNIWGAESAMLTLSNVFGADAGDYFVIVSNSLRTVTSQVVTLTVKDPTISTSPTSQLLLPGQTTTLNVTVAGTETLNYQWRKDGMNILGATASALTLTNVQATDTGIYAVVVNNAFGTITSSVATVTVNLATVDSFAPEANSSVSTLALQPDGRILIGGSFTNLGGQKRHRLARLQPDGTLDPDFDPEANGYVSSLAVLSDGKILVAGNFTKLGGQDRKFVGRLNEDGTLDSSFNPNPNGRVLSMAVRTDDKIWLGGGFSSLGGQMVTNLGRLNADGSLDPISTSASSDVYSIALQADGKTLVSGAFTTLAGQTRNRIGRLNADGTLDMNFNPAANMHIYSLAIQADGKVLIGGAFTLLDEQSRNYIARLNPDGTLDTTFNPGANNTVISISLQADRKILVAGSFTTMGGQTRARIARLNEDGTLDLTFNPGANGSVSSATLQPDGNILLGGTFTVLGGQARSRIARLNAIESATQALQLDGSNINWLRGGASPEVWHTTFEISTNDATWVHLGIGTRIAGGWQLTNVFLPSSFKLRARGLATGGQYNGSSWFLETIATGVPAIAPTFLVNDNNFGFFSNQFGFNISGIAGRSFILEGSTNLVDWISLVTNTLGHEPFYFADPDSTNSSQRFYRTRVP